MMKSVAIIPARGGSKRIPGKNIKSFHGQPMISWPIKAARNSDLFDRIIVSTDNSEIAAIARDFGAETPFTRPASLADDFTPTADVIIHALDWLASEGMLPARICCIYATAAFVQPEFLREGLSTMLTSGATSVFSVTTYPSSIWRALRIGADNRLAMVWPEHELTRSSDLAECVHDAGQFYWLDSVRFLEVRRIYTPDARPVMLPRYLVQDIDTPEDWERAERMFAAMKVKI